MTQMMTQIRHRAQMNTVMDRPRPTLRQPPDGPQGLRGRPFQPNEKSSRPSWHHVFSTNVPILETNLRNLDGDRLVEHPRSTPSLLRQATVKAALDTCQQYLLRWRVPMSSPTRHHGCAHEFGDEDRRHHFFRGCSSLSCRFRRGLSIMIRHVPIFSVLES